VKHLELHVTRAQRDQNREENAAGARIGRRLRIRDHEEREEQQRAVFKAMERDRQRLA
jgi:hypothetical protein